MLTRKEFKRFVEAYEKYQAEADELDMHGISLYANQALSTLDDYYILMLCNLMDLPVKDDEENALENYFWYNHKNKSIDDLYDEICEKKALDEFKAEGKYYSVEEEDEKSKPIDWTEFFTDLLDGTTFSVAIRKAEEEDE